MRRMVALALGLLVVPSVSIAGRGSIQLIDNSGLKFFINTNTNVATSSASGACSEASYTHAVAATTLNGGTTMYQLNDAFDGFYGLIVDGTFYTNNGPGAGKPAIGTECPGPNTSTNRQVVFNNQSIGNLVVSRKIFVPDNDSFARWLNIITNIGGGPEHVIVSTSCNLGSDNATKVVTTSSGDATATITDTWVTTFQDYSGLTTTDPRLGHVLQGPGTLAAPLKTIDIVDGGNNPTWSYEFDLAPNKTAIVVTFVTGQPSKAAAAAKSAELVDLPATATQCMTPTDLSRVVNFCALHASTGGDQSIAALGTTTALGGSDPGDASGTWSVVSGGTGTFNPNANTPNATFTHTGGKGPVVLRWTVTNAPCAPSTADATANLAFQPLVVKKAKINLNFAKSGADSMSWSGTLPVPAGFTLAGQTVGVDLGGVQQMFTLDAKGRGTSGSDHFRLKVRSKHGQVAAQDAKFTLTMRGAYASQLASANLTGSANVKPAQPRTVTAIVAFDGMGFLKDEPFSYTARASKSGRARST